MPRTTLSKRTRKCPADSSSPAAWRACRPLKAKLTAKQKTWQCDEYPFASTYEGAHYSELNPNSGRGFSVGYVRNKHNNKAGTIVRLWYKSANVIARDKFYVEIEQTAGSHEQDLQDSALVQIR